MIRVASRYDSSGETATDKPLGRTSSYTRRETRLAALNKQEQDSTTKDYKKVVTLTSAWTGSFSCDWFKAAILDTVWLLDQDKQMEI